jgi:DNA-binding winged helix-turn-helix (wHTH) protein/TolB-like protein/tetratricopeptide (TPR) repeat protein
MRHIYEFGAFRVDESRRLLLREGVPVPLKPKAVETLLVLLRNRGRVVAKEELLAALWPDTFVEEGNLTQHISQVRKALGETPQERRYIVTVPGQGYRFIADATVLSGAGAEVTPADAGSPGAPDGSTEPEALRAPEAAPPQAPPRAASPLLQPTAAVADVRPRGGRRSVLLISAVLVAAAGVLLYQRGEGLPGRGGPGQQLKLLAVLPFKPLDAESSNAQLELGMADALITRLGNVGRLTVRPTSAVLRFQGSGREDPVECGRALGVEAVVDGKIQKAGERLRVTVQLMRVADGASLWADTFDGEFGDIFSVQDEISVRVARALTLELTGAELDLLVKRQTTSPAAYEAYLKGRYLWGKRNPEDVGKAAEFFRRAVETDPGFASAYVGLADCFILPVTPKTSPRDSYERAKVFALKALDIDEGLADAHASLAFVLWRRDWDWAGAEKEFRRAIELNPRYATARQWYGLMLGSMGRFDEAVRELTRAQESDPLSLAVGVDLGAVLIYARRPDRAAEQLGKVLELDKNFISAHTNLAFAYASAGRFDEAAGEARKLMEISGGGVVGHGILAYVYAASGERERAAAVLNEIGERWRSGVTGVVAAAYWSLGERDKAFALLEEGFEHREWWLSTLKVHPIFDGLRADPRYLSLLRRTGLAG